MKVKMHFVLIVLTAFAVTGCLSDSKPYDLSEGYMYVQKEERRNESVNWELVWQDDFDKGVLDTTVWTRIGLFESPKWKVPVAFRIPEVESTR